MADTVTERLHRNPAGAIAMVDPRRGSLTCREMLDGAHRLAGQLAGLGAEPGATVASVLPNGVGAAQLYLGALHVGRAAPMNPALKPRAMVEQLNGVDPRVIVTTPDRVEELDELSAGVPVVALEHREQGPQLTEGGRPAPEGVLGTVSASDSALVLLTSGTTGAPKRVSLSHANLLHAVDGIIATLGLEAADTGLLLMPQFHIHGLQAGLLAPLVAGGRVVIPGRFDAFAVSSLCGEHGVTWYTAVATMHGLIVDRARRGDLSWTERIRFTRCSSAPMPAGLFADVEAVLGAPLIEAYGMTECAHQIASNPLPPEERVVGTVGFATGVEIRIADDREDGRGEVLVRGRSVTAGYEDAAPEVNERAFTDGWFHTGDEGMLDDCGRLTLTGRLKELINRGGEKIRPQEVEDVLASHPAVKEVAVFAVPHARLGEEVAAVVVPTASPPSSRDLRAYAGSHLASFKVPRRFHFVDEIPRGPTGKVQRSRLADQLGFDA